MGLFRRPRSRSKLPAGRAVETDSAFPFLSRDEAASLRALARAEFARRGVEVLVYDDRLTVMGGAAFGLDNLARACHASGGPETWSALVRAHAEAVVPALDSAPLSELSQQEVAGRAFLRLVDGSQLARRPDYAREVADGLLEVLALDEPLTVRQLTDHDLEHFDIAALHAAGLAHLVAEPTEALEVFAGTRGEPIHVVEGSSVYTASKLLVLPDLLRKNVGERDYPEGVLVAVPTRHQLMFHPIEDLQALAALQTLASLAATEFAEGVGPLSPHVYWWRDGTLTQLSFPAEDGGVRIEVGEALTGLLERLAPGERPGEGPDAAAGPPG